MLPLGWDARADTAKVDELVIDEMSLLLAQQQAHHRTDSTRLFFCQNVLAWALMFGGGFTCSSEW